MDFVKSIQEAKDKSKKRKFIQTMEIVFNFKNVDFSKQDNRINLDVFLPKGRGKSINCGIISDDKATLEQAKKLGKIVINKDELSKLGKDKKALKKLIKKAKFFMCQPQLMTIVAKELGQVLGPQGKMPKPIPPNANIETMIKRFENIVPVKSKGKFLPTVQAAFGSEDMSNEDLAANATEIFNQIKANVKGNEASMRSVYVKTSMGPSIKVELPWQKNVTAPAQKKNIQKKEEKKAKED